MKFSKSETSFCSTLQHSSLFTPGTQYGIVRRGTEPGMTLQALFPAYITRRLLKTYTDILLIQVKDERDEVFSSWLCTRRWGFSYPHTHTHLVLLHQLNHGVPYKQHVRFRILTLLHEAVVLQQTHILQ